MSSRDIIYYSNFQNITIWALLAEFWPILRIFSICRDSLIFSPIQRFHKSFSAAIAVLLSCTSSELSIYQIAKFEQRHLAKVIKNIINHNNNFLFLRHRYPQKQASCGPKIGNIIGKVSLSNTFWLYQLGQECVVSKFLLFLFLEQFQIPLYKCIGE